MQHVNHLELLTLIVGLSVYVATIRLVVIGRLIAEPPPSADRKAKYKRFLKLLIPADAALVISGVVLVLQIFWSDLFGGVPPGWFIPVVVWTFFIAVVVLALHHAAAWFYSLIA